MRTRIQVYDATFDVPGKTDSFALQKNGVATKVGGLAEGTTFSDSDPYWHATKPDARLKRQKTGTTIKVTGQNGNVMNLTVTHK